MIPADFIGTLPGWGTLLAIVTMGLRWEILRRRASTAHLAVEITDQANIRDHYSREVAALRKALSDQEDRFRKIIAASDERHEECEAARTQLHNEVSVLRKEIDGLIRVIAQASIDRVVMLGDNVPVEVREAAARAQTYIKGEKI